MQAIKLSSNVKFHLCLVMTIIKTKKRLPEKNLNIYLVYTNCIKTKQ